MDGCQQKTAGYSGTWFKVLGSDDTARDTSSLQWSRLSALQKVKNQYTQARRSAACYSIDDLPYRARQQGICVSLRITTIDSEKESLADVGRCLFYLWDCHMSLYRLTPPPDYLCANTSLPLSGNAIFKAAHPLTPYTMLCEIITGGKRSVFAHEIFLFTLHSLFQEYSLERKSVHLSILLHTVLICCVRSGTSASRSRTSFLRTPTTTLAA